MPLFDSWHFLEHNYNYTHSTYTRTHYNTNPFISLNNSVNNFISQHINQRWMLDTIEGIQKTFQNQSISKVAVSCFSSAYSNFSDVKNRTKGYIDKHLVWNCWSSGNLKERGNSIITEVKLRRNLSSDDSCNLIQPNIYDHLIIMVNGLYGKSNDWDVLCELFEKHLDKSHHNLFYASRVNQSKNTLDGIGTCGDRLAFEISEIIKIHKDVTKISFITHSMGGLIARYVCGKNYNPQTNTIFGLEPRHFMSIATPHLGVYTGGHNTVPMLAWGYEVPFIGNVIKVALEVLSPPFMSTFYKLTGKQLFMTDIENEGDIPLIYKLAHDINEGHYFSSLASFKSRTCYANTNADALVGWANASLRRTEDLPKDLFTKFNGKGVYNQDPIENGITIFNKRPRINKKKLLKEFKIYSTNKRTPEDSAKEDITTSSNDNSSKIEEEDEEEEEINREIEKDETKEMAIVDFGNREQVVEIMLKRLEKLSWCRIDVAFKGLFLPFMAHTHIQVTRKWADSVGVPVADHIAKTFIKLENSLSKSKLNEYN